MRLIFRSRLGGDCSSGDLLFRYVLAGIDHHPFWCESDTVFGKSFLNPAEDFASQHELLSGLAHELYADNERAVIVHPIDTLRLHRLQELVAEFRFFHHLLPDFLHDLAQLLQIGVGGHSHL